MNLIQELPSFQLSLRARNLSPSTIKSYRNSVTRFSAFLESSGRPTEIGDITARDCESFIADLLERGLADNTANAYYRGLKAFFKWAESEGLAPSPMERLSPPKISEKPVPVVDRGDLKRLFSSCPRKTFHDLRDRAIIRLLIDSGMRCSELSGMSLDDVDLELRVAYVVGKGNRPRTCPFGHKTAQSIDRYLRARAAHKLSFLPNLWLGRDRGLASGGVLRLVKKRGGELGVLHLHPHRFRHTFASMWLEDGGTEVDLKQLGGWRSSAMLSRYGRSAASQRALKAHHSRSMGDRL